MKWLRKWRKAEKQGAQKQKKCFLKFRFYHVQREKSSDPERPDWNSSWNALNHSGGCYDVSSFTEGLFAGGIDKMLTPRQPNVYCAPIRTSAATRRIFKTNIFNPLPGISAFCSHGFQIILHQWLIFFPPSFFWPLHTVNTRLVVVFIWPFQYQQQLSTRFFQLMLE